MDKPISLRIDELINTIAQTINESGIPIWMIENDFTKLAEEVSKYAKMQKEQERKAYEESLASEEETLNIEEKQGE